MSIETGRYGRVLCRRGSSKCQVPQREMRYHRRLWPMQVYLDYAVENSITNGVVNEKCLLQCHSYCPCLFNPM